MGYVTLGHGRRFAWRGHSIVQVFEGLKWTTPDYGEETMRPQASFSGRAHRRGSYLNGNSNFPIRFFCSSDGVIAFYNLDQDLQSS